MTRIREQGYGKLFRDTSIDSDLPMTRIMREFPRPQIDVEPTDYGMRIVTMRRINDAKTHVRVTNLVFPHAFVIPMSSEMTITQWHVPIDDTRHYWYAIFTSFGAPVNKDEMRRQRLELYELPDYVPRKNKSNDYGFDPHEQDHETFTGMGTDINVHDQWACELMGADPGPHQGASRPVGQGDQRLSPHPAQRDRAGRQRRQAADGARPAIGRKAHRPRRHRRHRSHRDWQGYWKRADEARRKASSWANG